ncbi:hypothetical protein EDC04DRAFT_3094671 [Pisolithus marmoratus]|nr:hypothetical protein EDC04DRAFT_3094671 [Pisolithus marmoratus]
MEDVHKGLQLLRTWSIEELKAPDFKCNASTEPICQHAAERKHNCEASQNTKPSTIKVMQFTFSVDQPSPAAPNKVLSKPHPKPCPEFKEPHMSTARCGHQATHLSNHNSITGDDSLNDQDSSPPTMASCKRKHPSSVMYELQQPTFEFPSLFSNVDTKGSGTLEPFIGWSTEMEFDRHS